MQTFVFGDHFFFYYFLVPFFSATFSGLAPLLICCVIYVSFSLKTDLLPTICFKKHINDTDRYSHALSIFVVAKIKPSPHEHESCSLTQYAIRFLLVLYECSYYYKNFYDKRSSNLQLEFKSVDLFF